MRRVKQENKREVRGSYEKNEGIWLKRELLLIVGLVENAFILDDLVTK